MDCFGALEDAIDEDVQVGTIAQVAVEGGGEDFQPLVNIGEGFTEEGEIPFDIREVVHHADPVSSSVVPPPSPKEKGKEKVEGSLKRKRTPKVSLPSSAAETPFELLDSDDSDTEPVSVYASALAEMCSHYSSKTRRLEAFTACEDVTLDDDASPSDAMRMVIGGLTFFSRLVQQASVVVGRHDSESATGLKAEVERLEGQTSSLLTELELAKEAQKTAEANLNAEKTKAQEELVKMQEELAKMQEELAKEREERNAELQFLKKELPSFAMKVLKSPRVTDPFQAYVAAAKEVSVSQSIAAYRALDAALPTPSAIASKVQPGLRDRVKACQQGLANIRFEALEQLCANESTSVRDALAFDL